AGRQQNPASALTASATEIYRAPPSRSPRAFARGFEMMSDYLSSFVQRSTELVAVLVPMAILFTTMVCLFALLRVGCEIFYRNLRGRDAPRYRPGSLSLLVALVGTLAIVIFGWRWVDSLSAPPPGIEIFKATFTVPALYFMASAVLFDIGAVLLLCSEMRVNDGP